MWALMVLVLYGLILELVQIVVPGRNFSWMDLFADSIGVVAGNFIFLGYVKVKKILAKG
jgi:VanZ family protein